MIIVDESNSELSNSLISSLKGRGIECGLFSSIGENFPNVSEKTFLSCKPEDFDLKSDKEFIPFLKSNGFKKAALLILGSSSFQVEKHLNGAITAMKIPALDGIPKQQVTFFLNYFIEQVVQNLPNLPCSDEQSV